MCTSLCTFPSDFLSHAQLPRLVSTTEMYWGGGGGSCAPLSLYGNESIRDESEER